MNFRNNGQTLKSKTEVILTSLLDWTPSDPSKEHCRLSLHILLFKLKLWKNKADTCKNTSNPKLNLLPPTEEALMWNILRAHYQPTIWKSKWNPNPPNEDPRKVIMRSAFNYYSFCQWNPQVN